MLGSREGTHRKRRRNQQETTITTTATIISTISISSVQALSLACQGTNGSLPFTTLLLRSSVRLKPKVSAAGLPVSKATCSPISARVSSEIAS